MHEQVVTEELQLVRVVEYLQHVTTYRGKRQVHNILRLD